MISIFIMILLTTLINKNMENLIYDGLDIEYNGYTLSGLYSYNIKNTGDTIYISKTKINQLIKQ